MTVKSKNGFVIELMVIFMCITFGFCIVITTLLSTVNAQRKLANQTLKIQADLFQVGEYYIRALEAQGAFPSGSEDDFTAYGWMDEEAISFFEKCRDTYHYNYQTFYSIKRASFWDFFEDKYILRKLVVSIAEHNKLVVVVKETYVENGKAEYDVLDWSVGSDITVDNTDFKQDNLNILEKLWKFFGLTITNFRNWHPTEFADVIDLLRQEFSDAVDVFGW